MDFPVCSFDSSQTVANDRIIFNIVAKNVHWSLPKSFYAKEKCILIFDLNTFAICICIKNYINLMQKNFQKLIKMKYLFRNFKRNS